MWHNCNYWYSFSLSVWCLIEQAIFYCWSMLLSFQPSWLISSRLDYSNPDLELSFRIHIFISISFHSSPIHKVFLVPWMEDVKKALITTKREKGHDWALSIWIVWCSTSTSKVGPSHPYSGQWDHKLLSSWIAYNPLPEILANNRRKWKKRKENESPYSACTLHQENPYALCCMSSASRKTICIMQHALFVGIVSFFNLEALHYTLARI